MESFDRLKVERKGSILAGGSAFTLSFLLGEEQRYMEKNVFFQQPQIAQATRD